MVACTPFIIGLFISQPDFYCKVRVIVDYDFKVGAGLLRARRVSPTDDDGMA